MAQSFEVAAEVAAPAQATWSVLTDWERQSEWAMLTRTRGIGPTGGHALGEQVHAFTGVGPVGFLDSMVIDVWDPPRRCRTRKTGRVVGGYAEFRVEPVGDERSRVVYRAEYELPPVLDLLWPLGRPGLVHGFRRSLAALAGIVEAEHRRTSPPARG